MFEESQDGAQQALKEDRSGVALRSRGSAGCSGGGVGGGGDGGGGGSGRQAPCWAALPSGFCGIQDEGVAGSRAGGSASQHVPEWPGQVCLLPSRDPPHLAVSAGVISSRGRGLFCKGRAKETPALVIRRR